MNFNRFFMIFYCFFTFSLSVEGARILAEPVEEEQASSSAGDKKQQLSPYGVLLRINEFEQLPDGRSRIQTIGVRRFKVLNWS